METKLLYSESSYGGGLGAFELKITVGATKLPDLDIEAISTAAYEAAKRIKAEVGAAIILNDKAAMTRRVEERKEMLALFKSPIYVEEIPNGYCSEYCCRHLPWFIVTTAIGRFKIGWRKSVILIDWSETVGTKPAELLFKGEDVTKDRYMIHAWSLAKAQEYIDAIFASYTTKSVDNQ